MAQDLMHLVATILRLDRMRHFSLEDLKWRQLNLGGVFP